MNKTEDLTDQLWRKDAIVVRHAVDPNDKSDPDNIWYSPDSDGSRPQIAFGDGRRDRAETSLREILKNPPVEYLEELARTDPKAAQELAERATEQVALEFRRTNPDYVQTPSNAHGLVQELAKKHLGADHLSQAEAILELHAAGAFTVPNLEAAYKDVLRLGLLEVPAGHPRELTREQKLAVIALIRVGQIDAALSQYLRDCFGGVLPSHKNPHDLLTNFPDTCRRAVEFVFFYSHDGLLDRDTFETFKRAKLNRMALPTLETVEAAWTSFQLERMNQQQRTDDPPRVEEPRQITLADAENMSDEELEEARIAQMRAILDARAAKRISALRR